MVREIIKYTWYFIFLVLFQTLILNNIQFSGLVNPYLYVLFILLLPFETPKFVLLVVSFLLGLSIDMFTDTVGMHASACIVMAFTRPYLLEIISPRDGYDPGSLPRMAHFGFDWYLKYSVVLIVIHHLTLFFIEMFTFSNFLYTLGRTVFSIIFTLVLVYLSQLIMYSKARNV